MGTIILGQALTLNLTSIITVSSGDILLFVPKVLLDPQGQPVLDPQGNPVFEP